MQASPAYSASRELEYSANIGKWKRKDIQYCRFATYDLTYAHYCKFPSWELQAVSLSSVGATQHQQQQQQTYILSSSTKSAAHSSAQQPLMKFPLNAKPPPKHINIPCHHKYSSSSLSFPHLLSPKYSRYFSMFLSMLGHFFTFRPRPNDSCIVDNDDEKKTHAIPKHLMAAAAATMPIILFLVVMLLELAMPFMLVYNIEECSPLVLFSWWRNKISWDLATMWFVFEPIFHHHQTAAAFFAHLCWPYLLKHDCRPHHQKLHWHKLFHQQHHQHRHKILSNYNNFVRWFLLICSVCGQFDHSLRDCYFMYTYLLVVCIPFYLFHKKKTQNKTTRAKHLLNTREK